ncbi:MAG: hypothetical protein JSR61_17270 [Proteobacteria bacterium]|nr:hypothetical protein [Pseudomonadota bacterium]
MVGATLSRWSMSYFAVALACLLAGEALMVVGFGFPSAELRAPDSLVLVHLIAIGWLSLLMFGALFQFVPVLVAKPIYSNTLPLPTLALLVVGLTILVGGFLQLGGRIPALHSCFSPAAVLLGCGFALALWNLGRTLWQARPLPLAARFVTVGLLCAAATATLGFVFALVLDGSASGPPLADIATYGIPVHAIAGLSGWLTFTAIGVSYRLLAMFMLAPESETPRSRAVLYYGTAALAVAIVGGTVAIGMGGHPTAFLLVAGLLGTCALSLYGADILHLYRARKRRKIELNARMAAIALANLAGVAVLSVVLVAASQFEDQIGAIVFLAAFGWLTGLGLAKLYKIVAFLTWLECFGPVLGTTATPRVQDLVVEPRAAKWFWIYFAGVWSATACLLLDAPEVFRASAVLMLGGTTGIAVEIARTRLLLDVRPELRILHLARRPALLASQ